MGAAGKGNLAALDFLYQTCHTRNMKRLIDHLQAIIQKHGFNSKDIIRFGHPSFGAASGTYWEAPLPTDNELNAKLPRYKAEFFKSFHDVDLLDTHSLSAEDWLVMGEQGWLVILRKLPRLCPHCHQHYLPPIRRRRP